MLLVLNMIDIARRRGIDIDRTAFRELGVPVVTSTAVRRGGTEELLAGSTGSWRCRPARKHLAAAGHVRASRRPARGGPRHQGRRRAPRRPDTITGRVDAVLLHPVAGLSFSLLLFVMFQAVFAWATPLMERSPAASNGSARSAAHLPDGMLQSFIRTA